jgi:predicted small lipoprotein YifL
MRAPMIVLLVILAMSSLSGLSACGKRGDLYLPIQATEH